MYIMSEKQKENWKKRTENALEKTLELRLKKRQEYENSPTSFCLSCNSPLLYLKRKKKFCSKSCSATYNNTHKSHGTRRSKFEKFCEEQLVKDFPQLVFEFNKTSLINYELDIYIPQLRLAIELNGIVHYEPIYGQKSFEKIHNRDKQKLILCYEKGVELAVINTIKASLKKHDDFYNIIKNLIIDNLNRLN